MFISKLLFPLFSSLIVLSLGFTTVENSCTKIPSWLIGTWQGVGYQIDGQTWDVILQYDEKKGLLVDYPTLGCNGSWEVTTSKKNRLDIIETIITGDDVCDQSVRVVLQKINDTDLSVTYYLPSFRKGPVAYTVLEKK